MACFTTFSSSMAPPFPHFKLSITLLLLTISAFAAAADRAAPASAAQPLAARLQADTLQQCWESLMELRSCTGEVILFFLNGETYLGPACCRAIRVIEHRCWAAEVMLAALGFTPQEGDVLRGYCDAEAAADSPPRPPPPPVSLAPTPAGGL